MRKEKARTNTYNQAIRGKTSNASVRGQVVYRNWII